MTTPITDWIEMKEVLSNKYLSHSYKGDRLIAIERKKNLEAMRKRMNQFVEVFEQIEKILNELYIDSEDTPFSLVVDKTDLSLKKIEELQLEFRIFNKTRVITRNMCWTFWMQGFGYWFQENGD